jgi:glycosyltransferase involved in cell wall biosynthesis
VFLFPSTTDTFGNVVLEAQASGLATVVSDAGGPAEQVVDSETGYICRSGDARGFADVLIPLLRNRQRREGIGRAAREWAELHDWPRSMEPLLGAWRDALELAAPAAGSFVFAPDRSLSH